MDAKQRMADVKQLRSDVCHDFFNLIIQSGWQDALYQIAYHQVTTNGPFKDAYSETYSKMRQRDINNLSSEYTVEDMDVSIMRTVASFWNGRSNRSTNYAPMENKTLDALKNIKEDRNEDGHSAGNEDEEEIYLQGLLSLVNLRNFVKTVDKVEITRISDSDRLAYFQKYMSKINSLKDTLDDERIRLVQATKEIDRDIKTILESKNPGETWLALSKSYSDRAFLNKDDGTGMERMHEFYMRASDAGVIYAHSYAISHCIFVKNDPKEAVRRIRMAMDATPDMQLYEYREIVDDINLILQRGNEENEEMLQIINGIKAQGVVIEKRDSKYVLPEVEKREEERQRKRKEEGPKEWVIRIKP